MKDIEFRAWNKADKKWVGRAHLEYLGVGDGVVVSVKYKPDKNGGYSPESCDLLTSNEVDNLDIMQYTGLKDKNNIRIFENDIVKTTVRKKCCNKIEYEFFSCIKWADCGFYRFELDDELPTGWANIENEEIKVIGNIYDNNLDEICGISEIS